MPYIILAIPLRLAVATVFWNSAMAKLANWATAVELFREEYRLPLLPPELAAYLAVSVELTTPVLLVLGLTTRPVALILLGMITVIQPSIRWHGPRISSGRRCCWYCWHGGAGRSRLTG